MTLAAGAVGVNIEDSGDEPLTDVAEQARRIGTVRRLAEEAGVRLFEWEGPMIHAKTAVADGVWTRIGSSNLNLASLLSNWELDVVILDRSVASEMEDLFLEDLSSSVEVRLPTSTSESGRRTLVRQSRSIRLASE